jgi:hypothetical protein
MRFAPVAELEFGPFHAAIGTGDQQHGSSDLRFGRGRAGIAGVGR